MILSLALIPAVPKIHDWKHLKFIINPLHHGNTICGLVVMKGIRKSSKILEFDLFAIVLELFVLLDVADCVDCVRECLRRLWAFLE
jgi:hypothetical protein